MKIRIVVPLAVDVFNSLVEEEADRLRAPGTEIDVVNVERGPASIEGSYDEALAAAWVVEAVQRAEQDGCDGVFVDCFGDPGVAAAREVVSIPVVGGFVPAALTATAIAGRWSVVTVLSNVVPLIRDLARKHGLEGNVASVRHIDTPVLELQDHDLMRSRLLGRIRLAVRDDGAEAVVLGCTGMMGLADDLAATMADEGVPVPVVDPTAAAIAMLESLHKMGVSHSRLCYHQPTEKLRII